jgi:hypothetical protein
MGVIENKAHLNPMVIGGYTGIPVPFPDTPNGHIPALTSSGGWRHGK